MGRPPSHFRYVTWHRRWPAETRMSEYVYSMYKANKFFGTDRQVLADISLSFFHGAKIGVLGPNGSGKSTLLRIMAGREETSSGEAQLAPGRDCRPARAGARPRSGQGRARERRGRRARAARPARPLQRDLRRLRRARRRLRRAARRPGEGAGRDRPPRRLVARRHTRPRDGRAAAPRRRPRRNDALGRRAPPRRALPRCCSQPPTCSCWTSRRTISTPSPSTGSSASSPNTRAP